MGRTHRLLLIFVDGVGLAPSSESNPLSTASMPELNRLLGGPLCLEQTGERDGVLLKGLDTGLGVDGLPQSATGQATLFTGVNAAALLGRHLAALPGKRLRELVAEHSLFLQAAQLGLRATFANAYSEQYLEDLWTGVRRPSVTTCAVQAAGGAFRSIDDLLRGCAVTWDIERDLVARHLQLPLPRVTAFEAGMQLARLACEHHLTVFETFLTDLAGHHRWGLTAELALRRIDGLLGGVLRERSKELTVVVTSDHGNLEDATVRHHTRNSVPLLVVGPLVASFRRVPSLVEVSPTILRCLSDARKSPS